MSINAQLKPLHGMDSYCDVGIRQERIFFQNSTPNEVKNELRGIAVLFTKKVHLEIKSRGDVGLYG